MPRIVVPLAVAVALAAAAPADASRFVRYGIQDDAWLVSGPGTIDGRLASLETSPDVYDWSVPDLVVGGLRGRGIAAVATIYGTPAWANGGRPPNWAPSTAEPMASFAAAAARRYPWVRDWLIWNEPNQQRWLRPTTPAVYVQRLLNPAYAAIRRANPRNRVGGGVTAPRGATGGVAPVDWIRGMGAARARLDAYAHHPHALDPRGQTPWTGGCAHCATITMASLERLIAEVKRAFGPKRIWLTEFGYQTNPPDRFLGVSWALQARYVGDAARRAHAAPLVEMLIQYLVRDDRELGGWQSGLFTAAGKAKPAYAAFRFPVSQASRSGTSTRIWGQVRPRAGRQPFRLRIREGGSWRWAGGTRWTDGRGFFTAWIPAPRGAVVQLWSPRDRAWGHALAVR